MNRGALTILWAVSLLPSLPPRSAAAAAGDAEAHVRTLEGHGGSVMALSFSPREGAVLASSSRDKTIRLWDAKAGKLLRTLEGHAADVYCVTFSAKGDLVASGSADRSVRLWDGRTWEVL